MSTEPEDEGHGVHTAVTGALPSQQVLETTEVKAPEAETKTTRASCSECGSTSVEIAGGMYRCSACGHSWHRK